MSCLCGDPLCPSCGSAQGTYSQTIAALPDGSWLHREGRRLHIFDLEGDSVAAFTAHLSAVLLDRLTTEQLQWLARDLLDAMRSAQREGGRIGRGQLQIQLRQLLGAKGEE